MRTFGRHGNNPPGEVVHFLTLDIFKIHLDRVLGHLVKMVLLLRKAGRDDPLSPLTTFYYMIQRFKSCQFKI